MAKNARSDFSELKKFTKALDNAANKDLKREYNVWLEAIGMAFLGIVHGEIIRLGVVDTRRLLNSFHRGNDDCIFELNSTGLVLKVGTNVEYASFVNDGHWTTAEGVSSRWVPGKWTNKGFQYEKGSKEGMLLKRRWVEGYHYFDVSITILEKIIAAALKRKMVNWLRKL